MMAIVFAEFVWPGPFQAWNISRNSICVGWLSGWVVTQGTSFGVMANPPTNSPQIATFSLIPACQCRLPLLRLLPNWKMLEVSPRLLRVNVADDGIKFNFQSRDQVMKTSENMRSIRGETYRSADRGF